MSSNQTACTAPYCGFHFPQWNSLYSPQTGIEILFCHQNKKNIPTSAAAMWNLKVYTILVDFYLFIYLDIIISRFLCIHIFRLDGGFMNCSVTAVKREMSRWCMTLMYYSWGGWAEFQQPDREKLCYWSVSNASGLLTWYLRDLDINCRSALGIILQRNYRDFGGKNAEMTKEAHWLTLHARGWSWTFNHTNINHCQ